MDNQSPLKLHLDDVTKVYPGVVALDSVSLSIASGEVLGLIGENGAGKSTLLKILAGGIAPSRGRVVIDGEVHSELTPRQSAAAGIAFVHQELNPFDNLDVAANVLLGREIRRGPLGLIDRRAMNAAVQPILDRLGARFRPTDPVAGLSLAERQLLEIARALSVDARLVILDEPTSSLTLTETERLLEVIADLKAHGVAVLFVSHRLAEVEACADRVVVLRDGHMVGELDRTAIDRDTMIGLMIGRELEKLLHSRDFNPGAPVLEIAGLRTEAHPLKRADLTVRAGEILGLAGLVGAGRTELARAAFGVDRALAGEVSVGGRRLSGHGVPDAIAAGLFLVPEDRKEAGLILDFAIAENIALPDLARLSRRGFVDRAAERRLAATAAGRLSIKAPDLGRAAAELSGGNQQKVVLAKWLSMGPKVMIFDEPTRGIDVGAKAEIYKMMRGLADEGVAILMISSDMEEVIGVSDRIAVMCDGEVTGVLEQGAFTEQNILSLAVA